MRKRPAYALLLLVFLGSLPSSSAAQPDRVEVVNPEPLKIDGTVDVRGTVRQGTLVALEAISVPPSASRRQVNDLASGGTITTDGFTHAVLSLQGEWRNREGTSCTAGALLVPDKGPVLRAFREDGVYQFTLEAVARLRTPGTLFYSDPQRVLVGFPSYRVFFFNDCPSSAEVNLYVYLTSS